MKIYRDLDNFQKVNYPVVTMGSFDGVHVGHQKLIQRLSDAARLKNGETVVITFAPHPRQVLFPDNKSLKLINTQREKIDLMRKFKVDNLVVFPFSIEFSKISSIDFIRKFLVEKIHAKRLVIGYDHHFGNNREGDFEYLYELGKFYDFEVDEVSAQDIGSVAVSSTKIRNALLEGNIKVANEYLTYEYPLGGKVIVGNKIGKTLGFPTANIELEESVKLIPVNGAYAVKVEVGNEKYNGMINIGVRPTLNNHPSITNDGLTIEVNIFNFNKDIYNEFITVYFIDRIRNEEKFESLDQLKNQLHSDKLKALEIFNSN